MKALKRLRLKKSVIKLSQYGLTYLIINKIFEKFAALRE